ncbi:hypothetical protein KIPB_009759, partial [Kipferlia bialata]
VFLSLLKAADPEIVRHLRDRDIDPLTIAMPWMVTGFAGRLKPHEYFLLWDRIIGFDSLLLLPILAAAVFVFKAPTAMLIKDKTDLLYLFDELSAMEVVPILQAFLFPISPSGK